ncbi:cytochrome c-type biogenesis protein CcmH [Cupriavidus sp. YR651]|uniref:c-type cytochrome biogenesis protein CcmI n=1 Tax=Cupriavidus sp. YR651 TaxID=1855315 RepID=UPI00088F5155|nr:c-type cytochrome biogenesis protein CcmI [Cupriavidus sp. YR651]SDE03341.1 cytochrome c-type biogenesis protein CcmH [Cupriavidus sp. YR651]
MTAFWLYAALLFATALAFILVPQVHLPRKRVDANRHRLNVELYRERLRELETQHDVGALDAVQLEAGRVEVARELLDDSQGPEHAAGARLGRVVPLVAAPSVPLLALVLYLHWGSVDRLVPTPQHAGQAVQSIEKVSMRLEALLAARPDSSEGWSLLGRAYMAQERMDDAARAFERAVTLAGRPPELLGYWAEALYFAGGRQWTPQLQALTDEALASNPQEAASLKLVGMAAFRAGHYVEAATYWERLATTAPEGDPSRAAIANDIARARELAKPAPAKGAPG